MNNDATLPQLFYDTDIIAIRKGLLDIDFFRGLARPSVFSHLAKLSATLLDDYAADVLVCRQDSLTWVPSCAAALELPAAWLRNDSFLGLTKDSKRAIHCSLLTPTAEELTELSRQYQNQNLELNAVFSLLGIPTEPSEYRLVSLITLPEVLLEYRKLYLITEDEYQRLTQLQTNTAIQ